MEIHTQDSWELLSYELDGALTAQERTRLDVALAATPQMQEDRRQLQRLDAVLTSGHVAVDSDFRVNLLARLPAAGWESRHPQSWKWAIAVLLVLGASSAALVGAGSAQAAAGGSFGAFGAAGAVFDLFAAGALAGAGLLAASWKGIGLAIGEIFARPGSITGLGVFVVLLNLLFLSFLRAARRAAGVAKSPSGSDRTDRG